MHSGTPASRTRMVAALIGRATGAFGKQPPEMAEKARGAIDQMRNAMIAEVLGEAEESIYEAGLDDYRV